MKVTYIDNLFPYLYKSIYIGKGSTALCFLMKNGKAIKLFKNNYEKEKLFNFFGDVVDHFLKISEIKNDTYIVPEEVLILNGNCVAYIYEYVNSKIIKKLPYNTNINLLMDKYDKLEEDTFEISEKRLELYDTHDKNVLFKNEYKIIDLDQCDYDYKDNDIFKYNMLKINNTIIRGLFGVPPYKEIVFYNINLNELYRKTIHSDYIKIKELFKELESFGISTKKDVRINKKKLIYTRINDYYKID